MNTPGHPRAAIKVALIIGILLIAANLRAPFTALPPLLGPIQASFQLSAVALGALTTLPLLAFALLSPFGASFARRWGLEWALFGAMLAVAVGIGLRSAGAAWLLYAGTAVLGAGIAIGNVLLPSLIKRDFPHSIASLTGAYALSMGLASALGSAIVTPIAQGWGWRSALLSFAVLPVAALLVWMVQLKASDKSVAAVAPTRLAEGKVWRYALAWQITLFLGLNSTIYYIVVGWLPAILAEAGMSAAQAGSLHGVMQLATAVPGLLIGAVLRRFPDQRLVAATVCTLSAIALLGWWLAPQLALVWSILFGLGTGASIILGLALVGLRTHNAYQTAALSGMAQCLGYLLASLGPMVMGALHDAWQGWSGPLALTFVLAVIAGVMGVLAGRDRYLGGDQAGSEP